ncbi:uncharacterized protein LOC107016614 [Solanum pennellii]|uniref:Uncharacterized protein LOC107016614 n=1 Tax=Solanum pennellii TaxID=28526 RepID=A0ABM1GKV4_SOLPN|nr:uncharacterized protein LOC107016614 [Solanum pennellii]
MTNEEIREALLALARSMNTHVNRGIEPRVNAVEITMTSRFRDFVRMNPPIFLDSKAYVYAQSIEESKLSRISRNLMRSGPSEKNQPRFKKRAPIQDEPRDPKVKLQKGSGSQNGKLIWVTCGKKNYGKCLVGNGNCFGCGKDGHKVRDCPTIAARGKEGKKVPPSVLDDDVPRKNRFYAIWAKGSKPDEDDVGKS